MKKINFFAVFCGIICALTITTSAYAKTVGEKLDKTVDKVSEGYKDAKNKGQEKYESTKENAKEKYNDGLEKLKTK
ncbi:MAG: hypothetical protein H0V82_11840 [Candidatus Protochlamydia sp.]|nr:hypothetical protein [Candidatus Protochlamydia sp.]